MSYELSAMSCERKRLTWRKILGGLEFSGYIFGMFCIWMLCSSFAFRPQVDVIGMAGESEDAEVRTSDARPYEAPAERDVRAEEMARVVYGTALYNSEEQQKAVMWCIINRVESGLYPNTVEEVCRQPMQWMGYSGENPVLDRLYDMGCEVLAAWESGGSRNLPKDCLWFDWNGTESITFRTDFEGKGNTWVVE